MKGRKGKTCGIKTNVGWHLQPVRSKVNIVIVKSKRNECASSCRAGANDGLSRRGGGEGEQ